MQAASGDIIGNELNFAVNKFNSGDLESATTHLDSIIDQNPSCHQALILKSIIEFCKNNYDYSLDLCNKAISLSPESHEYILNKAKILFQLDKIDSSEKLFAEYLDINPSNKDALIGISEIFYKKDKKKELIITLLRLANHTNLNQYQKLTLFSYLNEVQIQSFSTSTENGILKILDYQDIEARSLSNLVRNYLIEKYHLKETSPKISLKQVLEDRILVKSLPILRFSSLEVENFLCSLRLSLLKLAIADAKLNSVYFPIIRSLSLNNFDNEYVAYISEDENKIINELEKQLKQELETPNWTPEKSTSIFLIVSLYKSFYDLEFREQLLSYNLDEWPLILRDIAKNTLYDIDEEIKSSKNIATLEEITDSVSIEVQNQYEQNPYPRWKHISIGQLKNISELILRDNQEAKDRLPNELFNEKTPILIAGCGTGQQPITKAMRFPNSKVTAIDISRRSLAYAKKKSHDLNVKNINFYHADILNIPKNIGQFYYIECCGVLHHMKDPVQGWKKLLEILKPKGVMKIALYSSTARELISKERKKISFLNLSQDSNSIRKYREALKKQVPPSKITRKFADFYSLSECRDLLFHQHEKCYSWNEIEDICNDLNLTFLGLCDNTKIKNAFIKQFPNAKNSSSFEKLKAFEKAHPSMFVSMYQFFVQKEN